MQPAWNRKHFARPFNATLQQWMVYLDFCRHSFSEQWQYWTAFVFSRRYNVRFTWVMWHVAFSPWEHAFKIYRCLVVTVPL